MKSNFRSALEARGLIHLGQVLAPPAPRPPSLDRGRWCDVCLEEKHHGPCAPKVIRAIKEAA
jgi:hypothetical protein